jgi:hypothetical protein
VGYLRRQINQDGEEDDGESDHRCVTARLVSFVDLAIVHGTADQVSELTERRYRDSGALEVKADADTKAVDVHGAHAIVHRAVNENPIWLMAGNRCFGLRARGSRERGMW